MNVHPTPDRAWWAVARIVCSDIRELFDAQGRLRPIDDLPDDAAAAIASIKIVRRGPHVIRCVRFWDQPKALEMLLAHFGLLRARTCPKREADLVVRLEARRKRTAGAKSPRKSDGTGVAEQR